MRQYIFLAVVLILITLTVIYLTRRLTNYFELSSKWTFGIIFTLVPVLFITSFIAFLNTTNYAGHLIYKLAMLVMGFYIYLLLIVMLIDLVSLIFDFPHKIKAYASLGITLIMTVYSYVNSTIIRTTEIEVPLKNLTEEIKAVHLTDVHIGHFRLDGFLDEIIQKTNAQTPDIVFITGDYLDSKYALDYKYFEPLRKINAPIYFVGGNHDLATNNEKIFELMERAGVNTLRNEIADFKGIQLIGLKHMAPDSKRKDVHTRHMNETIESTMKSLKFDKDKPSIVLHHAPNGIKYTNDAGVDLYIAGHTHAGQFFPFSVITEFMFEYNKGLHNFNGTQVFVSQGIGTFGPPFRLGTISEIVTLNLKAKN
jgi:predicted MPP superfamily phosphohydrolase